MVPSYLPGDRLLVRRHGRPLKAGDVVVVADLSEPDGKVLRRVVFIRRNGMVVVAGDNPARGSQSRQDHQLPRDLVLGRVVRRLSEADRPRRRTYT